MKQCTACRSYAININPAGDLCDVCYWRVKSEELEAAIVSYSSREEMEGFFESEAHKALAKYRARP